MWSKRLLLAAPLLALAACGSTSQAKNGGGPTGPEPLHQPSPEETLSQWICPNGNLTLVEPDCDGATPQTGMANQRIFDLGPNGAYYQANDSLKVTGGFVNTWSYGVFGPVNVAIGDGGETYVVDGERVKITSTQDGGKPFVQEFCGEDGWVAYETRLPTGKWGSRVMRLWSTEAGTECDGEVYAYTRWRLEAMLIPRLEYLGKVPVVISEHYNEESIELATQMERSFFYNGRRMWESWTTGEPTGSDLDVRCPRTEWSVAPKPGMHLSDCRAAVNIQPWAGDLSGWKGTLP